MTKFLLSSLTTFALAASATTIFAQDPQTDIQTETEMASSEAVETVETETEKSVEETYQMEDHDSHQDQQDTDEMEEVTKDRMKDASSETQTVACPEGTELREDGNCHVSDDWTPER